MYSLRHTRYFLSLGSPLKPLSLKALPSHSPPYCHIIIFLSLVIILTKIHFHPLLIVELSPWQQKPQKSNIPIGLTPWAERLMCGVSWISVYRIRHSFPQDRHTHQSVVAGNRHPHLLCLVTSNKPKVIFMLRATTDTKYEGDCLFLKPHASFPEDPSDLTI